MRRSALLLCFLIVGPAAAQADLGKLDPRARVAFQRIRSAGVTAMSEAAAGQFAANRAGELDVMIRGTVTRAELEAAGARVRTAGNGFFTAWLPAGAVERVAALPGVARIGGSAPVELELNTSVPATGATVLRGAGPSFTGLNGAGVVVGDVDSGVDYNHPDFFNEATGTTRFVGIWDQNDMTGPSPSPYGYGTNWTPAQITSGACTEMDVSTHGTHVLGIAGGDGSGTGGAIPAYTYAGMAPKADLCMVKTNFSTLSIVDGVSYVFDKATALGKNAVCNLSLGSHLGPHDGTSDFESALSSMTGPGRIIVKSAGNDRGSARHAEINAAGTGSVISMNVTGSSSGAFIAISGFYNGTENLSIRITTPETAGGSPDSTVVGPIARGTMNAYPGQSTNDGAVYIENGVSTTINGAREIYIEISIAPLSSQNMNGLWKITFVPVSLGASNGEVDLWRFSNSVGTTATFVAGNTDEELISEPGNAVNLITVGAYVTKSGWTDCDGTGVSYSPAPGIGTLASFSSAGPTRDGRQQPDLSAPGMGIGSTTSFDITQSCASPVFNVLLNDNRMHVINQGTSMAAPHVAGAVALLLQKRGALSVSAVKDYLRTHAAVDAFTGAVWNKDWGHGKLQLGDLVDPTASVSSPNGGQSHQIGDLVNLTWSASDVLGSVANVDLQLSRAGAGGPFENIALGVANSGTYAWTVTGPPTAGATAFLKVTAHDTNQNSGSDLSNAGFEITSPTGVIDEGIREFDLARITPNPTPGRTVFDFALPRAARVKLSVVDLQGRVVARVVDDTYQAGRYQAEWTGERAGRRAAAGLYFVRYEVPGRKIVRRLVLTR